MWKIVVHDGEKALVYRKGQLSKILDSGRYLTRGREFFLQSVEKELELSESCKRALLAHEKWKNLFSVCEIGDRQCALHLCNGRLVSVLFPGFHLFWKEAGMHEFTIIDTEDPACSLPNAAQIYQFAHNRMIRWEIPVGQVANLYYNGAFVRTLPAGVYHFWKNETTVTYRPYDTRLIKEEINGQEILTRDKVPLRVNFIFRYRITDLRAIDECADDPHEQLYLSAQLSLRDAIARRTLDEILGSGESAADGQNKGRAGIAAEILENLRQQEQALCVHFESVGVKDLILPGEIRSIMNSVLLAEKQAQATAITRREEVASTRSLLNTARMMQENPVLYHLKELEYVERISAHVGNISLCGSGDFMSQLSSLLCHNRQSLAISTKKEE